jgi:hypothetical protein
VIIQAQETLKANERRARTRLLNARRSAMVITSTEIGTAGVSIEESAVRRTGRSLMYLKTSSQSQDPELPMRLVVFMPNTPVKKESGSWNDVRAATLNLCQPGGRNRDLRIQL